MTTEQQLSITIKHLGLEGTYTLAAWRKAKVLPQEYDEVKQHSLTLAGNEQSSWAPLRPAGSDEPQSCGARDKLRSESLRVQLVRLRHMASGQTKIEVRLCWLLT